MGRTPFRTCSQLSRTSSSRFGARNASTDSTLPTPACRCTPSTVLSAGSTASASVSGASSHHQTPSGYEVETVSAARRAIRVFPPTHASQCHEARGRDVSADRNQLG